MPWEINRLCFLLALFIFIGPHSPISGQSDKPQPYLPGTKQLNMDGDIASEMVAGIDRFLLEEIKKAEESREKLWRRDFSSRENYLAAIEPHRKKLAHILGVRDKRLEFQGPEKVSIIGEDSRIASTRNFDVNVVRWPVFDGVQADGLLLTPKGTPPRGYVIALPDADHTPEQLIGLVPGLSEEAQFAKILASHGMRVLIPTLIDRSYKPRSGRAKMTNREYIHRSAFELGRLLIGYEIQKTLSGVDWFSKIKKSHEKIAVVGWGEGGLIAFYAAALDPRIEIASVSGYFGNRNQIWQHPLDRNVFGLLEQFGDAQVASMIAPRCLIVGTVPGPSLDLPSEGGAPSQLRSPAPTDVEREWKKTLEIVSPLKPNSFMFLENEWKSINQQLLKLCGIPFVDKSDTYAPHGKIQDRVYRQDKQLKELDRFNQQLLSESAARRNEFLPLFDQFKSDDKKKKVSTKDLPSFAGSMEPFRNHFYTEIIGKFSHELSSPNPRSRLVKETPQWSRYQVLMDVFPGVIAYGILTIPKNIKQGEKRPVVVCQHGLEGRPEDCISEDRGFQYYKAFATKLAEPGFVTFAPQNPYIFGDRFRSLQRKANPLKKTLFSIIIPQHQQITNWLKSLPFIDGEKIGFYGLSYGGKTAMRVPPLVSNYCLSICSADFNDWVWKNASTQSSYSYVWTNEYEIFEFDLANTFNYAEMASLIAPRPFMVERGHFDGVAPDDRVAMEFAKVRFLYQGLLGIGDKAQIEWFAGPHTINGKGTFDFLHKHLNFPRNGK